ncbi:hypothetical protein [Rufibacter sp. LB8]|nr:hypothetical protein [Rufibacter sp. LB8]
MFIKSITLINNENINNNENRLGGNRYLKKLKFEEGEQTAKTAVLMVSEEELYRRVKDLEVGISRLYKQFMFLGETWWHLLNIDYDWIPLSNYLPPRKTIEFVYGSKEGEGVLMKDGLLVSEYDALSLEGKVQYYKELETTRTKFQFDLGHYIHLIYMAVWGGKEDFNKLVMGDENTPVPEEKKKEIKERMAFFSTGAGMEKIHPQRKNKKKL